MMMNRGGPKPVNARIFADRGSRYEKVLSQSPRSSHGSGFAGGFNFGRGTNGGYGNSAPTTDFLELQRTPTKDKDADIFDHDLHTDKEGQRDRERSLSPHSRDSDSV